MKRPTMIRAEGHSLANAHGAWPCMASHTLRVLSVQSLTSPHEEERSFSLLPIARVCPALRARPEMDVAPLESRSCHPSAGDSPAAR